MNPLPDFKYHVPTQSCPIDMKTLLENNKRDLLETEDNVFIDEEGNIIDNKQIEKIQSIADYIYDCFHIGYRPIQINSLLQFGRKQLGLTEEEELFFVLEILPKIQKTAQEKGAKPCDHRVNGYPDDGR